MKNVVGALMAVTMTHFVVAPAESATLQKYFGKSYALVVGINQYESAYWEPLKYAVKDAEAMAGFLEQQHFEVKTLYDKQATRRAILYHLNEVLTPILRPDDRVLVFFAGHGGTYFSAGRNHGYIVPVDGDRDYGSNIQMDELRTAALLMDRARHQLFIMDACYGGLLAATRGSKIHEEHPTYLDEITRRRARQVLTAGGADQQVADGGPGGHSQFTYHLLQALEGAEGDLNGDGYITFAELAAYIVPVAYSFQQTPTYSTLAGHGLGEFIFLSPESPTQMSTPPREPDSPRRGANPTEAEKVLDFVSTFIKANNDEDVGGFVKMFSSKPDYYSWGPTSLRKIEEDKQYFFRRWPDVEYTPIGEPEVIKMAGNRFQVNIKFDFYVRSVGRCEGRHGESSFRLEIENTRGGWKITSIKENVYYRDKAFQPCIDQHTSVTSEMSSRQPGVDPADFEEILGFVTDFFEANNGKDVDSILGMFSTKPDYYSWGPTPLHKIKEDKQSFFARWPKVHYAAIGRPEVTEKGSNHFEVSVTFDFYVRNITRCEGRRGESSFNLGIKNTQSGWKITSIKEDVHYQNKSFNPC